MGDPDDLSDSARAVFEHVQANPYTPHRDLADAVDLDETALEDAVDELVEETVLITMTRQSGSSHESRVSEVVYLVNPDRVD